MLTPRNLLILGGAILFQSTIGGGFSGMQQMQIQGENNRQTRAAQDQEATNSACLKTWLNRKIRSHVNATNPAV